MKKSILLASFGFALIAVVPAGATTTGFDFTQCTVSSNFYGNAQTESSGCGTGGYSNTSNSFSQTVTGIGTVTATAYATTTTDSGNAGTAISGANSNAEVGQYTGNGIGVCSAEEDSENGGWTSGNSCSSPYHQVNDDGAYEFILFTFSTAVDINNITLANFGGGPLSALGIAYWVNPASLTTIPGAATFVECGAGDACPTVEGGGSGIGTGSWMTPSLNLTDVKTLLVGADTRDVNDFFKIQGLSNVTDYTVSGAPEPATFGLIGLSLAGLGLLRRKRKV
jgi:hypothetical protein